MALVIGSGFLGAPLSGAIGSSVFARNKGGSYVRIKVKPTNPRTSRQTAARLSLAAAAVAWSQVPLANRGMWDTYAAAVPMPSRAGGTIRLSGQNQFVRAYATASAAGQTALIDDLVTSGVTPLENNTGSLGTITPAAPAAEATSLTGTISGGSWNDSTNKGALIISATAPYSPTRANAPSVPVNLATVVPTSVAAVAFTAPVPAEWYVGTGMKIDVFANAITADGRVTGRTKVGSVTVA